MPRDIKQITILVVSHHQLAKYPTLDTRSMPLSSATLLPFSFLKLVYPFNLTVVTKTMSIRRARQFYRHQPVKLIIYAKCVHSAHVKRSAEYSISVSTLPNVSNQPILV